MKRIILTLITVFTLITISQAQTKYKDMAIGFHLGDKEYAGEYGSEMFAFEGSHLAAGISLQKYLTRSWDAMFYVSYGMIDNGDSVISFNTHVLDFNAVVKYKFNNGYIMNENAKVAPFLMAGIGDSYNVGTHMPNGNTVAFNFPIGGGIDFKITDDVAITLMSAYNYSYADNLDGRSDLGQKPKKDAFLFNSIGVKFNFPSLDADGDGITDKEDVCPEMAGPISTIGCPEIKEADKNIMAAAMKGLLFETGSSTILTESYAVLDNVYNVLSSNSIYKLSIEGHTDNTGSADLNNKLSGERANAAREYLIKKGIDSTRIVATGYGSASPVATNDTPEGRKQNRRVEFKLMF